MQYRVPALLIALATATPALADEVAAREARLLAAVEAAYLPATGPRAPGLTEADAHLAVREAHRLLDEGASPALYPRLRELLSLPPEIERLGSPSAPGNDGVAEHRTKNFRIAYYTKGENAVNGGDADGNGLPDKVEWAAEAFELAYRREVLELGYPAPPDLPRYRVVLKRLSVNALTHPEGGGRTWCEFNFAMRDGAPADQIKAKFRAVAIHEFFHAVQATLNWDEEDWFTEGSADWMSELADPGNGFYLSNASLRLERPEVGLASSEPFFPYAGSLFSAFLSNAGKPTNDYLKEIWLDCGARRKASDQAGGKRRTFVRDAIGARFGRFEDAVTRFWPHVYLRNFPQGTKLPRAARLRVKSYPARVDGDTLPRPDPLGANFVELHPVPGSEGGTLTVRIAAADPKARFGARLLALGKDEWKSIPLQKAADGALEYSLTGYGTTWRAATCVVVNVGRAKSGYTLSATSTGP